MGGGGGGRCQGLSGSGTKALFSHPDPLGFDTGACLHLPLDAPVRSCQKILHMFAKNSKRS